MNTVTEQDLLQAISLDEIETAAKEHPDDMPIGVACNSHYCPVANILQQRFHSCNEISVGQIYINVSAQCCLDIADQPVSQVIQKVDMTDEDDNFISKARFLEIIQEVRQERQEKQANA